MNIIFMLKIMFTSFKCPLEIHSEVKGSHHFSGNYGIIALLSNGSHLLSFSINCRCVFDIQKNLYDPRDQELLDGLLLLDSDS